MTKRRRQKYKKKRYHIDIHTVLSESELLEQRMFTIFLLCCLATGYTNSEYIYKANGSLTVPEKEPYTLQGGFGNNGSEPVYGPLTDFDYQSLNLALYQEHIELDLFLYGLSKFSNEEYKDAGLNAADRFLIKFMADQEVGHATMLTNILGPTAAKPCTYQSPFKTVREFIDFCQKLTRFGESGVYGFIEHLDSRPAAQLLLQSITTEARQQMIFRQFGGLFPMPVWFEAGITQSMAWTLLAPYIFSCPESNLASRKLAWQNFPALTITNNPSVVPGNNTTEVFNARITPAKNRTIPISYAGRNVTFEWEAPGKRVGPNKAYTTSSSAGKCAGTCRLTQIDSGSRCTKSGCTTVDFLR